MIWIWPVADGVVWLKLTQRERERVRERFSIDNWKFHVYCNCSFIFAKKFKP